MKNWSIDNKLWLCFLAPFFFFSLSFAFFVVTVFYRQLDQDFEVHGQLVSQHLATLLSSSTAKTDLVRETLTRQLLEHNDLRALRLSTQDHKLIAHVGPNLIENLNSVALNSNTLNSITISDFNNRQAMSTHVVSDEVSRFTQAIVNPDDLSILGWVDIEVDRGALQLRKFRAAISIVLVGTVGLALAIAMFTWLKRGIVRPLTRLRENLEHLSYGDGDIKRLRPSPSGQPSDLFLNSIDRTTDLIKAANEADSEFLSNTSQEIRTPISGILDVEKIETDQLELDSSPFNSTEAVEDCINIFPPAAREKNISTLASLTETPEKPVYPVNILAVDDTPANLRIIGELLKDLGATVSLANSGMEALGLCEQQKFDLIFMDIQMPVIDGLETTRRIRRMESPSRRMPIVALTAHAMTDQKTELLLAGLDDYLSKPISENQLLRVIKRWVGGKAALANGESEFNNRDNKISADPNEQSHAEKNLAPVNIQLSLRLSNNKPELARDMLTLLLRDLPLQRQDICTYQQQANLSALAEIVHKIRGGASYCGVPKLKTASAKADELLRNHQAHAAELNALITAIDELIVWSEEFDIDALFGLETSS